MRGVGVAEGRGGIVRTGPRTVRIGGAAVYDGVVVGVGLAVTVGRGVDVAVAVLDAVCVAVGVDVGASVGVIVTTDVCAVRGVAVCVADGWRVAVTPLAVTDGVTVLVTTVGTSPTAAGVVVAGDSVSLAIEDNNTPNVIAAINSTMIVPAANISLPKSRRIRSPVSLLLSIMAT